ncbi:MAG TPA: glycosyltransferase, partial [Longimicrobiaceae bacterium]|nr:glycosyltransferase [Longimicrobiaceae bacterium]
RALRRSGVALYNFYPDTSAFAHGALLAESLPEYDCVFYTKRFWVDDVLRQITLRRSEFLQHGYDPEVHHPWKLEERDVRQYRHDVTVVATHTAHKERVLADLVRRMPGLDLRIWGNLWENCRAGELRPHIAGRALLGGSYAKAIGASAINLAIMSGQVEGSSRGDETTTRTYEIPACGGFMLHERSGELLELFEEGREVACFGSGDELADKIQHYLAHPEERRAIARAGHERCVPAYSYDNRMAEIVRRHLARGPGEPLARAAVA